MNIVITGGGTGGHAYPAISIAECLKETDNNINILYIGSKNGIEKEVAKEHGIRYEYVESASFAELKSVHSFEALTSLAKGFYKSLKILKDFKADLVFGTGGYVCFPVFIAQMLRRKPIVIHEQNAVAGKANQQAAGQASYICTTFEGVNFPKEKVILTGLPIRKCFRANIVKKYYASEFGLSKDKFTLLICGGSQGAQFLNDTVCDLLPRLKELDIQIIHQTGKDKYSCMVEKNPDIIDDNYKAYDFIDMAKALNVADLVISRAGASTLTEILYQGLPAIFIPYPHAAANHQYYNAKNAEKAGAAYLIEEKKLKNDDLFELIKTLVNDKEKLKVMSENARNMSLKDPEVKITEVIFKALSK